MKKAKYFLILIVFVLTFSSCQQKQDYEYWVISSDRYDTVVSYNERKEDVLVTVLPKLITNLYKLRSTEELNDLEVIQRLFDIKADYTISGDKKSWDEYNEILLKLENIEFDGPRASVEALFALTIKHQSLLSNLESSSKLLQVIADAKTINKAFKNLNLIAKQKKKINVYDMGRFIDRNFEIEILELFIRDWFITLKERSTFDE